MKSKKGALVYTWTLTIMVIAILAWAYIQFYSKYSNFEPIGVKQLSLFKTYSRAESTLLYVDQSAKYSAYQSIYDLGQKGGSDNDKCGEYFGYSLWSSDTKNINECFPDYEENFKLIFNGNLNKYLQNHPEVDIPTDNYEIQLKNKLEIIGLAISSLEIPIGDIGNEADESEIEDVKEYGGKKIQLKVEPTTTKPGIAVSYKYELDGYNRPDGVVIDRVILHHTGDDSAVKTYNTLKKRKLSVHYVVDRDGTIYYLVDERKMAFHAKGWNARSIGIEIVNTGYENMDYTPAQYASVNKLINDIAKRWPSIKADNEHTIAHYQASDIGKWDPSPNFDWSRIGLQNHLTLASLGKKAPSEFGYV